MPLNPEPELWFHLRCVEHAPRHLRACKAFCMLPRALYLQWRVWRFCAWAAQAAVPQAAKPKAAAPPCARPSTSDEANNADDAAVVCLSFLRPEQRSRARRPLKAHTRRPGMSLLATLQPRTSSLGEAHRGRGHQRRAARRKADRGGREASVEVASRSSRHVSRLHVSISALYKREDADAHQYENLQAQLAVRAQAKKPLPTPSMKSLGRVTSMKPPTDAIGSDSPMVGKLRAAKARELGAATSDSSFRPAVAWACAWACEARALGRFRREQAAQEPAASLATHRQHPLLSFWPEQRTGEMHSQNLMSSDVGRGTAASEMGRSHTEQGFGGLGKPLAARGSDSGSVTCQGLWLQTSRLRASAMHCDAVAAPLALTAFRRRTGPRSRTRQWQPCLERGAPEYHICTVRTPPRPVVFAAHWRRLEMTDAITPPLATQREARCPSWHHSLCSSAGGAPRKASKAAWNYSARTFLELVKQTHLCCLTVTASLAIGWENTRLRYTSKRASRQTCLELGLHD